MNLQRLIERYKKMKANKKKMTSVDLVLKDLQSLDEPEKVKIPQFVSEHIEWAKEEDFHLLGAMNAIATSGRKNLYEWFWDYDDNMELFARAWLDGYEAEKEKRYLVKIKGICGNHETLNREKHSNKWLFSDREENSLYNTKFTRKELEEAGFGWVFDCEGIEIEEVEE